MVEALSRWQEWVRPRARAVIEVLERRRSRAIFWALVGCCCVGGAVWTTVRAENPSKILIPGYHYASPLQIAERADKGTKWRGSEFRGFRQISWAVVEGGADPYKDLDRIRAYPPFFGIAFFPFTVVWRVRYLGSLLFFVTGFAGWLLALRLSAGFLQKGPPRFGVFALLAIVTLPKAVGLLAQGESDLFVLLPLAAAFMLIVQRRKLFAGGACLGAAAAFKVLPLVFAGYLLVTRQWRALGGMLAGGVVCAFLLPVLICGVPRTVALYRSWADIVVAPYFGRGPGAFIERPWREINQSLAADATRLLSPVPMPAGKGTRHINIISLSSTQVRRLVAGLHLLIAIGLCLLWLARGRSSDPLARAAVFASVPIGMLLLSDVSLIEHHVVLLLPAAVVAVGALLQDNARAWRWLWLVPLFLLAIVFIRFGSLTMYGPFALVTLLFLWAVTSIALGANGQPTEPGPVVVAS